MIQVRLRRFRDEWAMYQKHQKRVVHTWQDMRPLYLSVSGGNPFVSRQTHWTSRNFWSENNGDCAREALELKGLMRVGGYEKSRRVAQFPALSSPRYWGYSWRELDSVKRLDGGVGGRLEPFAHQRCYRPPVIELQVRYRFGRHAVQAEGSREVNHSCNIGKRIQ